jgi:phosphopantothenoylcysteine synthetase/decarboxylase
MVMNILLGLTGSVAAIKAPELIRGLQQLGKVRVVATSSALKIIKKIKGYKVGPGDVLLDKEDRRIVVAPLITEEDEWNWSEIGDPVLHISLKDWADVLAIAPLTANTLAKMANGICDNLLTCIYRAWPVKKRIVVAPAMNTDMWNHPLTHRQLTSLTERHASHRSPYDHFRVIQPVEKKLACGTTGMGAMASVEDIVKVIGEAR